MKTIEIKIPELGNAVGTTAWVAPKLEQIQKTLRLGSTKDGEPCLTYEHWINKDKDGNPKRHILCFISESEIDPFNYDNRYGNVYCVAANKENEYSLYLFHILSQKAKEVVDEFLDAICQKFWEEYNEN